MAALKGRLCCICSILIFVFACLGLIQLFTLDNSYVSSWERVIKRNPSFIGFLGRNKNNTKISSIKTPIILWWTPFTGESGNYRKCRHRTCFFTEDRFYQNHSKTMMFMFYGSNFNPVDLPVPRSSHHEWALLHEESPKNNMLFCHNDGLQLFNHTSTFSSHSDFPLTLQYLKDLKSLTSKTYFLSVNEKNKLLKKIAPVLYIHSDCDTPSGRDIFVEELMKHIAVDSYGQCLHNKDLPKKLRNPVSSMNNEEFLKIVGQYKFTLSFENAVCNDYITEKLWRPLIVGSVPIYFGAPNVQEWLPNENSAIFVSHFKKPSYLAQFIKDVNKNDSQYNQYLVHKLNGLITNNNLKTALSRRHWGTNEEPYRKNFVEEFECFLCERIHRSHFALSKGLKSVEFHPNQHHYDCPAPKPPLSFHTNGSWWLDLYNRAAVESQVLKDLVAKGINFTSKEYHDKIVRLLNHVKL